jgi:uncharacterized protein YndB with AHSA1/START domain
MNQISNNQIISSRVINFPRTLVWRAYEEPEHLAAWWGPKGFTNTFKRFEFKPGGIWHFTMHGPGGQDFPNVSVFEEIVKPERIVLTHLETLHTFKATITFKDLGNKTEIHYVMEFESEEELNKIKHFVPQANEQNFDRLEAELARMK